MVTEAVDGPNLLWEPLVMPRGNGLALPEKVEMARPTGVGRTLATYELPIEGRDEWVAAARRQA